jgi:hypothetical protein
LLEGPFELAAGCVDIAAARAADEGRDAGIAKTLLEGRYVLWGGLVERHVRAGVPDDQVDLSLHIF